MQDPTVGVQRPVVAQRPSPAGTVVALELLAGIAGQSTDGVANVTFDLLAGTLDLVFESVVREIVCHVFPPEMV